jgi:hypothetical protein
MTDAEVCAAPAGNFTMSELNSTVTVSLGAQAPVGAKRSIRNPAGFSGDTAALSSPAPALVVFEVFGAAAATADTRINPNATVEKRAQYARQLMASSPFCS